MSQNSEELSLGDYMVSLSLAHPSKEEGSVSDHAHCSALSPALEARALCSAALAR